MEDIILKLLDLQKQATTERSHFYVAKCITEAIQEIVDLRIKLDSQSVLSVGDLNYD